MIEALLFDFDGVLTTDPTGSHTTTRFLSEATGIAWPRLQAAFRSFNESLTLGRSSHAEVWDALCRALGEPLDMGLLEAAFASTPMRREMLALARRLRPAHAVGIVTDNKRDRMDSLKRLHDLPSLFDPIVVSAELGLDKQGPAIFEVALRRLGVAPQACVFIDNSRDNLVAPQRLGLHTLYFDHTLPGLGTLEAELAALGVCAGSSDGTATS